MNIIVITAAENDDQEVGHIIRLFELGLNVLHIRKPNSKDEEIEKLIMSIPSEYYDRIVLHGHYDLAFKYKLKGIHLHRKHRSNSIKNRIRRMVMRIRNPRIVLTTSFNSLDSLRDNIQGFDYAFLNSVFTSQSYYHHDDEVGVNLLRSIVSQANMPIYARGGVDLSRIPLAESAGFAGVAISSMVWKNIENRPEEVYAALRVA